MDGFVTGAVVAFAAAFVAALPYVFVESRWRWRWREVENGRVEAAPAAGAYRSGGDVPRYFVEAPRLVRWAAFTSLLFGQMFVPGLLLGLVGTLVSGVGLVSVPGLIVAAKLYRAGLSLLKREPRVAYFRACDAVQWALWHNGIIMAGALLLMLSPVRPSSSGPLEIWTIVVGYGALSILQALLVRWATRRYEDALFAASARPCA